MIFEAVDLFDCILYVASWFHATSVLCIRVSSRLQKKRRDEGVEELQKKLINVAL